jgi:uncharacterized membrane protein
MVIDNLRGKISSITSADNDTTPTGVYVHSATLGFVAGLRSQTPFAVLSLLRHGNAEDHASLSSPLQYLNTPAARVITSILALGELVGDKLPSTPSRLAPAPLAGRLIIGTLVGWAISRQANQSPILGAILGAVGAASGSVAGYYARTWLGKVTKLPSPVLGIFEDILALGIGALIAQKTA